MKSKGEEQKDRILKAANDLFYRRGVGRTSFADIAEASGIRKGNFYFYFKTKDELLMAVLQGRHDFLAGLLTEWETALAEPRERLHRLVDIPLRDRDDVIRYGCPLGSISAELGKSLPSSRPQAQPQAIFRLILDWLEKQFTALGRKEDAAFLSRRLLARIQGASLLGNAFEDESWINEETEDLHRFIDAL